MLAPYVQISMNTKFDTTPQSFGRRFIEILCSIDSRLSPEYVSHSETYKERFIDVEDFGKKWWATRVEMRRGSELKSERLWGPFWKSKAVPSSRGYVSHGFKNSKGRAIDSTIWYQCKWDKNIDFNKLFHEWIRLTSAEIGMLHVFTAPEQGNESEAASWFESGSFGGPLKPGLPNIGWAMAYGESYLKNVDLWEIQNAAFRMEKIDNVTVIRVTETLSDVVQKFSEFSNRRAELKKLFPPGFFWINAEPVVS